MLVVLVAMLAAAPGAQAFGIQDGDNGFRGSVFSSDSEDEGHAFTVSGTGIYDQAAGHPYKGITDFILTGTTEDNVDNLRVDIPPGLMPNPNGFAKCSEVQLAGSLCPVDAQIGTEEIDASLSGLPLSLKVPLYNVQPRPDDVARFGFNPVDAAVIPGIGLLADALNALHPVFIVGGVRDSASISNPPGSDPFPFPADNGLFFTISDVPETMAVIESKLSFWGVPGAAAHDAERHQSCVDPLPCVPASGPASPAANLDVPFLTNPTRCTGTKLTARLIVNSHDGATANRTDSTPTLPDAHGVLKDGAQECDDVPVDGDVEVDPGTTQPDAPSGAKVDLLVPQPGLLDKDVFATSHVKDVSVTLPSGMTINPSAANGLQACTDAQLAVDAGTPNGDACPAASRIGDVSVSSPLLPDALGGNAYVGQPLAGDTYRLFVTVDGRGVSIRLKGSIKPNATTGQLTATFKGNPELPFDDLSVDFRDGPRAPLATPLDCGAKSASALFTPWSGGAPKAATSTPFQIAGGGCPAPFAPTFAAASSNPQSGALAPFEVTIGRPDRNQYLSRITVATPPGLAGMVSSVKQCADALAARGACPASTRIGTATTKAGAGSEPFALSGPVYFTGPYKGAPFGMVTVIRAIAGPYDLGTVVVRQSIFADPEDAHLTVVSDPLPTILEGVPIRLREVKVSLDRKGFVYNPTSCGGRRVGATLHSTAATAIARDTGVSFTGCDRLGFAPKLALRLTGPRATGFGRHPGLTAHLSQPARQANVAKARVTLPASLALDPKNSQKVCGVAAAERADCPASTQIGTAKAVSPALNDPLTGPVYLVQGIRTDPTTGAQIRTLPSLLAKLHGEVRVNVRGTTEVVGPNLVSTFDAIPDAPVSTFDMRVAGGSRGILVITSRRGVCGRNQIGSAQLTGQNAKLASSRLNLAKPCARPGLKIRRVGRHGQRLMVRGTLRARARAKVKVSIRCGHTRVAKRSKRPRRRHWRVALGLHGDCADAGAAKLRASYPGGGDFRPALRKRRVSLRVGS